MHDEEHIFRELAPLLRARPEFQPWDFEAPCPLDTGITWAPFHLVMDGSYLLGIAGRDPILLGAGDVAILLKRGASAVRALPRRQPRAALDFTSDGGDQPDNKIISGRLKFECAPENMVVAALEPIIVLRRAEGADAGRLRLIIELIKSELEDDRLGSHTIAASLASSLMTIVFRAHFEREHGGRGLLKLLARRQTAKALSAMLADPAREWTLNDLAEHAHTSRSTLVRLFRTAIGSAPLAFLIDLRLTLARHRILASKAPIAAIAKDFGYRSEHAFCRAYQRKFAVPPGTDRKSNSAALAEPCAV